MDASSFDHMKLIVESKDMKKEKFEAIQTFLSRGYGPLSVDQVVQLAQQFSFDDDRVKCIEICAQQMYHITCEQAATLLRVIGFDNTKIEALEVIASHITDNNFAAFDSLFSSPMDRARTREFLMNRCSSGPEQGLPPQPGVHSAAKSFDHFKLIVESKPMKKEKFETIQTFLSPPRSYGPLSVDQVAQLAQQFSFDDDRVKCIEICAPQMYNITCEQAASLLRVTGRYKMKALEVIASHITDNNFSAFDSVFSEPIDRALAREALMNRCSAGPQTGLPPQPVVFSGAAPPPRGFPAPAPYPGMTPYPTQNPYPGPGPYGGGGGGGGGMCPPEPYATPGAAPSQYPAGMVPPPGGPQYPPQGVTIHPLHGILSQPWGAFLSQDILISLLVS